MLFGHILRFIMVALTAFWVASFLIIRLVIFIEAYSEAQRLKKDDLWLLNQCMQPEFYSKIRHHTDLCTQVQTNAERSAFLHALNAVANTAHLCGRQSCLQVIEWITNGGWPTLVWIGIALMLGNGVLCVAQRFCSVKRQRLIYKDPYKVF